MELQINSADLLKELSYAMDVVEKKTTIPILSHVLLETHGNGLRVTATDLDLGIRSSAFCAIATEGRIALPAKRLHDYLKLLPPQDVNIKVDPATHWATITRGRSRTKIAGLAKDAFPDLPAMPDDICQLDGEGLREGIKATAYAISTEASRFTLNGSLLAVAGADITMVATDGHRLSHFSKGEVAKESARDFKAVLPVKAMQTVAKLAEAGGSIHFSMDDNHLFFRVGDRTLIARKISGNFPDYERVLPKEHGSRVTVQVADLKAALERVAQFADERSRAVKFSLREGEIALFANTTESGESEESVVASGEMAECTIGFNATYVLDFLRNAPAETVDFAYTDGNKAGELLAENRRYVVMPMRVG